MYAIHILETVTIFDVSLLGTNSSLNCSRVITHPTDRSGQSSCLYDYKLTSVHSHESEYVVSFAV